MSRITFAIKRALKMDWKRMWQTAGMLEKKDLSAVCSADYVKALVPEHPSVISATGKESDDNKTGRQEARDNKRMEYPKEGNIRRCKMDIGELHI